MAEEMNVENGAQPARTVRVNYPANSHKVRQIKSADEEKKDAPDKKVEKVIKGEVVKRKKGLGRKIVETFKGDDDHNVGEFLVLDVAIPALKSLLSDLVIQGVERTLFGDGRSAPSRRPSPGSRSTSYTSYNRYSSPSGRAGEADGPRTISSRARASHEFDEIVLATRGEAESVLDSLVELVNNYDVATVSDLYDLVGITGNFTDEKWGWFDLRSASIRPVRGGYLLNLPHTQPVD